MFKSWRNDKNKIKAVFKLQFQATQVPKLKKTALMISLVPDDVGKPTFKLEKSEVKEGICSWENPIYVSVKLIKEPKTGIVREKIYHFVVATGSSKSGFLGEASIDFADFLTEADPLTVSLPLKFANSGAVLNVTIHKIQGASDLKFIEENKDQTLSKEDSFKSLQSNDDLEGYNQDERSLDVNTAKNAGLGGSFDSIGESGWIDDGNARLPQRHNSVPATRNGHRRSNTDWSASSTSDESYIESRNSPENSFQRGFSSVTESSDPIERLKMELEALRRQSELSELEKQSLRKQAIKESKRIQELSKEVSCLKGERDGAMEECEKLRLQNSRDEADAESRLRCISEDSSNMIEEIRDELSCEKDLTSNLKLQLQRTQESNSNLILAVRDLNEMLEQKNNEISSLNSLLEEAKKLEEHKGMDSGNNEIDTLKQQIEDLDWELDSYKKKNEEQEILLDELTQEYESLKEENYKNVSSKLEQQECSNAEDEYLDSKDIIDELKSQIEILEGKLKQQSLEYSECLITVNELESQVKELKKELEDQAQAYDEDIDTMMREKTEQEQRAIKAEENLRKTRWNNAITAERLQEKCKRLSLEMESKLSEHENLTKKTLAEANNLRLQNKTLEEMQEKTHTEITQEKEQRKHVEEKNKALSMKVQMLESEVLKLTKLRDESSAAATETEKIIQEWRKERDEFERKLSLAKEVAKTAQKELTLTKSSNDDKETRLRNLKTEVEGLSLQYSELQNSFVQEKMENDELRKQVSNLKVDIRRKEEEMTKILDARMEARSQENGHKEENLSKLSDELAYCKNKNSSMERELKEMEERYSEISLRFAEVEGERQQLVMAVRNLKNGKKF
ncbi:Myosin heavy chain-related protein [Arabidopsis thaliana]|jgi:chromosome segregation ATPase|uniref:At5g52280 n=1 Tax=Arabidopsis thaliana TaxID=3702 RepID=Q9FHD1_ARATH|nr:Myosin heavy chain-related protein [Arabidopsis thaliana]AAT35237.1 At5g52280 [Arabidopsis thaliana]AED96195.1 Myosin heavy chain-related protein [Arabidopsis thaliana]BAB10525.1 hyaluronan mediated motility receptor-like protein [Arabidopsis thaliana]BAD44107.1 hyaluronan mediated motility receptor-like protein [Arabidopsis thaliana]|eukprot:NP_200041.1 Myosin heavy chain-related protein [Arabidopsis thaliana]